MRGFGGKGTLAAALVVALALGAAACGEEHETEVVEGEPLELGDLRFNVQLTRFLNPTDREDAEYLEGLPATVPGKAYLAVFIEVENEGDDATPLPGPTEMKVVDTTGAEFEPIETDVVFAFPFGETIEGGERVPFEDTAAASGPAQGSIVLFLVERGVTENPPLELELSADGEEGKVELDL